MDKKTTNRKYVPKYQFKRWDVRSDTQQSNIRTAYTILP